jgi:hypothetical protein
MSKKKKTRIRQGKRNSKGRRGLAPEAKPTNQNKDDLSALMAEQFEIVGDFESSIPDWTYWRPAKNL